jgi:hypothetical protein
LGEASVIEIGYKESPKATNKFLPPGSSIASSDVIEEKTFEALAWELEAYTANLQLLVKLLYDLNKYFQC